MVGGDVAVNSVTITGERTEIDAALVGNTPLRTIADRWSVSKTALIRHKADHVSLFLTKAKAAEEVSQADDLLAKVSAIEAEARRIAKKAEQAGNLSVAMSGVRELARLVELLAKLRGALQQTTTVNLLVAPEWVTLRTAIIAALAPYPEAQSAVLAAVAQKGNGHVQTLTE